jgi:predicted ATPase
MLQELQVSGYRSLRDITLKLGRVNVIVGPNGCGKSNLYRAVMLLQAAAEGRFARALAEEGGMPSVLWAGERKVKEPARVKFRVVIEDTEFELECGLPPPSSLTMFGLDPVVKEERIRFRNGKRWLLLLERLNASMWASDAEGKKRQFSTDDLVYWESVLSQLSEPDQFPAVSVISRELRVWRFYHQFRTDHDSPIRRPQIGTQTPILGGDGRDLAAAMQTIFEIGDGRGFMCAVGVGLGGAVPHVRNMEGRFEPTLDVGLRRPMSAAEMSDGMLRYLCLHRAVQSPAGAVAGVQRARDVPARRPDRAVG